MLRKTLCLTMCMLALAAWGQTTKKTDGKAATTKTEAAAGTPSHALMQQVWDAWSTLNSANAAKFYDKASGDVFFDLAPLKYDGWSQYEAGSAKLLSGFQSCKCSVHDDAKAHAAGSQAWSTATVSCDMVGKDGKKENLPIRWTAIWQKKGADWLIVHEHVSVPMP